MERKKKTVETPKKQAKLFHFAGFQKKDSNGNAEVFKFHCRFCGSGCKHDAARKSHENWYTLIGYQKQGLQPSKHPDKEVGSRNGSLHAGKSKSRWRLQKR